VNESGTRPAWLCAAAKTHDLLTRIGYYCSGACLAAIVFAYCYEVVARYFFSAPTTWASSLVSYLLCYTVFLAMPELSRTRRHIFIGIVLDLFPLRKATLVQHATYMLAAATCVAAAAFCLDATIFQYAHGITTVNEWRVPKWTLSIVIPYGFLSTGIYYVRHAVLNAPYTSSEVV
jgi:TRAP-type C4-dicarboxylate transport system permease small subunit